MRSQTSGGKSPDNNPFESVSPGEYDAQWIHDTWGWDTPESFIASQGRNIRPRVARSLEVAHLRLGMRILDIGCGRGEVVLHCGRMGIESYGVDYSREVLQVAQGARASHSAEEQSRMHFICGDIREAQLPGAFDRIFMLDFVEHLYDWQLSETLKACLSLLRPEGAVIIHTLPNRWLYDITYGYIIRTFLPWLPKDPRKEKEKSIHINEMDIVHLSNVLHQSGFNSRVWIEDLIVEQARWHGSRLPQDGRGKLYACINNPVLRGLYKLITHSPLRALAANDIFAIAWARGGNPPFGLPKSYTERLLIHLARHP